MFCSFFCQILASFVDLNLWKFIDFRFDDLFCLFYPTAFGSSIQAFFGWDFNNLMFQIFGWKLLVYTQQTRLFEEHNREIVKKKKTTTNNAHTLNNIKWTFLVTIMAHLMISFFHHTSFASTTSSRAIVRIVWFRYKRDREFLIYSDLQDVKISTHRRILLIYRHFGEFTLATLKNHTQPKNKKIKRKLIIIMVNNKCTKWRKWNEKQKEYKYYKRKHKTMIPSSRQSFGFSV